MDLAILRTLPRIRPKDSDPPNVLMASTLVSSSAALLLDSSSLPASSSSLALSLMSSSSSVSSLISSVFPFFDFLGTRVLMNFFTTRLITWAKHAICCVFQSHLIPSLSSIFVNSSTILMLLLALSLVTQKNLFLMPYSSSVFMTTCARACPVCLPSRGLNAKSSCLSLKRSSIQCPVIAPHVSLYREMIDWRIHNAISRHTLNWPEKQRNSNQ